MAGSSFLTTRGFDGKNPLKYTIMTHAADPSLHTVATIMKTQLATIGALWDQLKQAPTPEEFSRLSQEVQRYFVGHMVQMSATTLPFIQAARDYVKGYVFERGFKIRFETTWLDR